MIPAPPLRRRALAVLASWLMSWLVLLLMPLLMPLAAAAATITVAPGQSLEAALHRAGDGDRIEILAGEHSGQVGVITQRQLTLVGVGGRPVLQAAGRSAEGKAILVVRDGDVRIENLEFRGSRVPDGNGAGIRFERGRLEVVHCAFFDNQMGLLSANFGDAELSVQDSEFGSAPAGRTLPHLLYVGRIARFTLSGSRFSGGLEGHLVKSRARVNHVRYNQLVDGPQGQASYELEFPNGGLAYVVGNVIGQSPATRNPTILSFGAEGAADDRPQGLFLVNNTLINAGPRPAIFVRVHEAKLNRAVEQRLLNNLFVGAGEIGEAGLDPLHGNHAVPFAMLRDAEGGQHGLLADAPLRGLGVAPGEAGGVDLRPAAEFVPPAGTRARAPRGRWSPGAYQE
jgi:hypothetical protein